MKYRKNAEFGGFTLIELLVVISIIGFLAAIATAAIQSARNKGLNASVKTSLHQVRSQMSIDYTNGNTYLNLCTSDANITAMLKSASNSGVGNNTSYKCNDSAAAWAASSPLKIAESDGSTYWCVDSNNTAKGEGANIGGGVYTCP